ncbi:hypothetical protein AX17_005900 [Amanita inopinata Kibby_2008]|nr:hypothetical protein AX17_005900 [Amanita inopinata Kibby_2008]
MVLTRYRRLLNPWLLVFIAALIILYAARNKVITPLTRLRIIMQPVPVEQELLFSGTLLGPEKQPQLKIHNSSVSFDVLGRHLYHANGLLEVNTEGPHPIYELIERAERDWNEKFERASKTLEEAVNEYQRRYHRRPPKGFDTWWNYVIDHNVQLPDEYDQIYHDLEPFWGLKPTDLRETRDELESKIDSYTIGQDPSGKMDVLNYSFAEGRYDQLIQGSHAILDLLSDIVNYLPPFRAVLSPHDGPNRLSDFSVKTAALGAASDGIYINRASLPQASHSGWVSACSPSSPARQNVIDLDNPPPRSDKKTFIYDHIRSTDPCLHPEHFYHHGQFLSHNEGPTPQHTMVPEFSYCSTMIHHNIRIPTPYGWVEDIYPPSDNPVWEDKLDERLLWRGSNTGIFHDEGTRWQSSHRDFLVGYANDRNGTLSILYPTLNKTEKAGEAKTIQKSRINPAIMDIAFAGSPVACSFATCQLLSQIFPWRERQSIKDAGKYKYVLDVDGNGWSGRFKRLITSNSLVFKSTIYPEWYMDRIAPWVHYIPIQVDLSDLYDALIFFRGDANGNGAHEELARTIAIAGREWSKTFWRREDMVAYFFRLLLEYARLISIDRENMSYSLSSEL